MAYPSGVSVATITAGTAFDFTGADAAVRITVTPVFPSNGRHIVWSQTGQAFYANTKQATGTDTTSASIQVPHVNQAGFIDDSGDAVSMWRYDVQVDVVGGPSWTKSVQPLVGQTTIDLDLLEDETVGPITTPLSHVLSVNGQTGHVTVEGGEGGGTGSDPDAVKLTGNQTIAGIKTFTSAPVVPDGSFAAAKTTGLVPSTRTVAGKALSANVTLDKADVGLANADNTSDANKPVSTAQQAAIALKANDADVVKIAGSQTVTGAKAFTVAPSVPDASFTVAKINATGTRSSATALHGDGTWKTPAGGGGTSEIATVLWSGSGYPTQAASPPAGIKVRQFYGPEPYSGATWTGVLDVYTYAAL